MAKIDLKLFRIRLKFIQVTEKNVGGRLVKTYTDAFIRWAARRNYTTSETISMNVNSSQLLNTQQYIIRQSMDNMQNPDITYMVYNPDDDTQKLIVTSVEKDFLNQAFMLITLSTGTL
jgi:hypothetical protein